MPPIPQGNLGSKLTASQANKIENDLIQKAGYKAKAGGYPLVDTSQITFYSNESTITKPEAGADFYGQDAQYVGSTPSYKNNGNGTITDNVTGLMWQQNPGSKMTWEEAVNKLKTFKLAGYNDWRLPTIKELYSLINFSGRTGVTEKDSIPYIDTKYFKFSYGSATGERFIDSQYATSTIYESTTMNGNTTVFGVNFADGRIKGYPISKQFYVMFVRGNVNYGMNMLKDNGDGTITDLATGLMWLKYDSGVLKAGDKQDGRMDWKQALS